MDSSCLVMTPCGFGLLCKLVGEAVEFADVAVGTEGSVDMPGEAVVVDPLDPAAPVGPAGAGTGTVTTAGGLTTVGLSHALNASAISTAENTVEYFMRIPFECVTKTACVDESGATLGSCWKLPHIGGRFRCLAHITRLSRRLAQPMKSGQSAGTCFADTRGRTFLRAATEQVFSYSRFVS